MTEHEHNWQYADSEVDYSPNDDIDPQVWLYFVCVCGTVKKILRKELIVDA